MIKHVDTLIFEAYTRLPTKGPPLSWKEALKIIKTYYGKNPFDIYSDVGSRGLRVYFSTVKDKANLFNFLKKRVNPGIYETDSDKWRMPWKDELIVPTGRQLSASFDQVIQNKTRLSPEQEAEYIKNIKDTTKLVRYAKRVIKGRWPEAEERILNSSDTASMEYATAFFRNKGWPEYEQKILAKIKQDNFNAVNIYPAAEYALDIIHKRWPEIEKYLYEEPQRRSYMTMNYLKEFFYQQGKSCPEVERVVLKERKFYWFVYNAFLFISEAMGKPWPEFEQRVERDMPKFHSRDKMPGSEFEIIMDRLLDYCRDYKKAPWKAIQKYFQAEPEFWEQYLEQVLIPYGDVNDPETAVDIITGVL